MKNLLSIITIIFALGLCGYATSKNLLEVRENGQVLIGENSVVRTATKVVCASDSLNQLQCDYVCDGTADDVEIQAAIDSITAGKIRMMYGNYNLTSTIQVKSNIALEFENSEFNVDELSTTVIATNQSSLCNFSIKDLNIRATTLKDLGTTAIDLNGFTDADNLKFENIEFQNIRSGGIKVYLASMSSGMIKNVEINNIRLYNVGSPFISLKEHNSERENRIENVRISNILQKDDTYYADLFTESVYKTCGIGINGGREIIVENITTEKATDGPSIILTRPKNFIVRNVKTYNNQDYAVDINSNASNGIIENIEAIDPANSYWGAVVIQNKYFNGIIENITIRNIKGVNGGRAGSSLYLYNSTQYGKTGEMKNIKIENIIIEDSNYSGTYGAIALRADSGTMENIEMSNLYIKNVKESGIRLSGSYEISDVIIKDSSFYDIAMNPVDNGKKAGIYFDYANVKNISISNSDFYGGQMDRVVRIYADTNVKPDSSADKIEIDNRRIETNVELVLQYGNSVGEINIINY